MYIYNEQNVVSDKCESVTGSIYKMQLCDVIIKSLME